MGPLDRLLVHNDLKLRSIMPCSGCCWAGRCNNLHRDGPNMTLIQHFLHKGVLSSVMEGLLPKLCDYVGLELELFEEKRIGTKSYLILACLFPV